jgi:DNA ligase (NAD+)
VIPEITKVIKSKRPSGTDPFQMPRNCPICNGHVWRVEGESATKCTNPGCQAKLKGRLRHFVSRDVYDIEGFGTKLIEQLVDTGMVSSTSDIFSLTRTNIASLGRMGQKSAAKLIKAIDKRRVISFERFLRGLGIHLLGRTVSSLLADRYDSLEQLTSATIPELTAIEGIGDEIADYVTHIRAMDLTTLLKEITIMYPAKAQPTSASLGGKKFVITGKLSQPRDEIKTLIAMNGGKVVGSVSKNTDYLVAGENCGSKKTKALTLGITIISENDIRSWCHSA